MTPGALQKPGRQKPEKLLMHHLRLWQDVCPGVDASGHRVDWRCLWGSGRWSGAARVEERVELVDLRVQGHKVRGSLGVDKPARLLDSVQAAGAGSTLGLKVLRRLSKSACALSDKF